MQGPSSEGAPEAGAQLPVPELGVGLAGSQGKGGRGWGGVGLGPRVHGPWPSRLCGHLCLLKQHTGLMPSRVPGLGPGEMGQGSSLGQGLGLGFEGLQLLGSGM